jgi:hypothetical protein
MDALISTALSGTQPEPALSAPRRFPLETEAPERAARRREAPEQWVGQLAEAPDAGEGRSESAEHEFTQGRSQS